MRQKQSVHYVQEHGLFCNFNFFIWYKTRGDGALQQYVAEFPFDAYDVCLVEGLGSFYIDRLPDEIKGHLRKGIYWESTIGVLVRLFAQPNSVVVDFRGPYWDSYFDYVKKKVGPSCLVVAFEPQYKIFRELCYNLKLNQCQHNVIALRNAVGETAGICEMGGTRPN